MNRILQIELSSGTTWYMLAEDHVQARTIAKEMGLVASYKDIKKVVDRTKAWATKFPTGTRMAMFFHQQGQLFFRVTSGEKMTKELRKTGVVFEGNKDDIMERRLIWVLIPWERKQFEQGQ